MADLTQDRKSNIRAHSSKKGSDFFLGERTYPNILEMTSFGLSKEKSVRFVEKYLEAYGKSLVIALEDKSKAELARRGFKISASARKFGYFIEKGATYTLYVYLQYDDEWAPWARYIMGKQGNEVDKKGGLDAFRMSHMTRGHFDLRGFQSKRALMLQRAFRLKQKALSDRMMLHKEKARLAKTKEGYEQRKKWFRISKAKAEAHINSEYRYTTNFVIPIKKKGSNEVQFRTLPMGGKEGGTWIHPAISRFNFIDEAFRSVDEFMARHLEEKKRGFLKRMKVP